MKAFILLLVVVVIIGGSVGGAFIGGVAVGKGQEEGPPVAVLEVPGRSDAAGSTAAGATTEPGGFQQLSPEQVANFRQQAQSGELSAEDLARLRQQFGGGQAGAGAAAGGAGGDFTPGGGFRPGLTGTVKGVEGNEITISTAQGDLVATIGEETTIRLIDDGAIADLLEGMSVTVVGARDESGAIEATTITAAPEGVELGAGGGGFGGGGRGGGGAGGGGFGGGGR